MLEVENLDLHYGQSRILYEVSFQAPKGQITTLIGNNGVGKTSTLKAIAGRHPASAGTITVDGTPVRLTTAFQAANAGIAYVPQGREVFPMMTVEENLLLGKAAQRQGDWDIERIFTTFPNLVKRRHSKTGNLSGGEQQATAIGRALMANPELLILDEVSLGLSPLVVDQVYASIESLRDAGTTILLVEQDLERAITFSQRAICMLEGRIVLDKLTADTHRDEITQAYFGLNKATQQEMS